MLEIVSESAKYPSQLLKIYSNLSVFTKETISLLLLILNEFMGLEADPNPLSIALAPISDDFIDVVLAKPTYKKLLGIFAKQPETNQCLLRQEVLQKIAEGVASEGLSLYLAQDPRSCPYYSENSRFSKLFKA